MLEMVGGELGLPQTQVTKTIFSSCNSLQPTLTVIEAKNTSNDAVARPPPTYTCISILGVCGKTLTKERCYQLCYSYFSGVRPYPHCDQYPGIDEVFCYCEHDCLKPGAPSLPRR